MNGMFGCIDAGFWNSNTNVLFIPNENFDRRNSVYPCSPMVLSRSINSVVLIAQNDKLGEVCVCDALKRNVFPIRMTTNTSVLFNEKLEDLKGYKFTALIDETIVGNKMTGIMEKQLIMTIAERQNASFEGKLKILPLLCSYSYY